MTEIEQLSNELVDSAKLQWQRLVKLAWCLPGRQIDHDSKTLASAMGIDPKNFRDKIQAIRHAFRSGKDQESIIADGQRKTQAAFRKAKKEKFQNEPYVVMGWRVSPETEFAMRNEVFRHCKVLGIKDSETYFTWLHAEMCSWTPQQLRHSAGMSQVRIDREEKPPCNREEAGSRT